MRMSEADGDAGSGSKRTGTKEVTAPVWAVPQGVLEAFAQRRARLSLMSLASAMPAIDTPG